MLDKVKNWLSEKVNEYLHSSEFIDWAQQKAAPKIKEDLEEFVKQPAVKEKISEYQQNPELLEQDFFKATGYLDTVDNIFTIIDIASIIAIVLTFLESFGTSAVAGAGLRTFIQQVAKQGVKQVAKTIVRRSLSKVAAGVLKKYAVIGAARFSAGLLKELAWRVSVHAVIMGIVRGLEMGGVGALLAGKDAMRKYGVDLGIPPHIIDQATQPDVDAKTFKSILEKYAQDVEQYTINLVTSKTGLAHITMGGLARSLGLHGIARYRRFSDAYHGSLAAAKAGTLNAASYAKDYNLSEKYQRASDLVDNAKDRGGLTKKKRQQEQEEAETSMNGLIAELLSKSDIPKTLHPAYKRALTSLSYNKSPDVAKKLIEEKVSSADYNVASIEELLREMTTLDVMQRYEKILLMPRNRGQLQELLEDVSNIDTATLGSAMKKIGANGLADLAKMLRAKKAEEVTGLLDSLALGKDELDDIRHEIATKIKLDTFRKSLEEDIADYEQSEIPKSASKR